MITIEDFYGLSNEGLSEIVTLLMIRVISSGATLEKVSSNRLGILREIANLTPAQAASLAEQVSRLLKIRLEGGDAA